MTSLTRLVETDAHEGPVYVDDEALYFTTQRPDVAIKRLALATGEITTVRAAANVANGMALDADGRLIVCDTASRRDHAVRPGLGQRRDARRLLRRQAAELAQ